MFGFVRFKVHHEKYKLQILLQEQTLYFILAVLCWMIKDLMWQTVLIQQCEKFYLALQRIQDTCAVVLKSTCSGKFF